MRRLCACEKSLSSPARCRTKGRGKFAAGPVEIALRASPQPKAGMLRLHFEQVHRKPIIRTMNLWNRGSLDEGSVTRRGEVPLRTAVMNQAARFSAGVGNRISARGNLRASHLAVVVVAEQENAPGKLHHRHERDSEKYLRVSSGKNSGRRRFACQERKGPRTQFPYNQRLTRNDYIGRRSRLSFR